MEGHPALLRICNRCGSQEVNVSVYAGSLKSSSPLSVVRDGSSPMSLKSDGVTKFINEDGPFLRGWIGEDLGVWGPDARVELTVGVTRVSSCPLIWQDGPDNNMCGLADALDAAPELSIPQVERESVHCSAPSARTDDSHSELYMLPSKSKSPKGVLDVGEILSASDEETERPKVEPCSLAFCVSHVAGRVHVLDGIRFQAGGLAGLWLFSRRTTSTRWVLATTCRPHWMGIQCGSLLLGPLGGGGGR